MAFKLQNGGVARFTWWVLVAVITASNRAATMFSPTTANFSQLALSFLSVCIAITIGVGKHRMFEGYSEGIHQANRTNTQKN
jgi:hypothetical protein